jgi:hypothetical protein
MYMKSGIFDPPQAELVQGMTERKQQKGLVPVSCGTLV